MKRVLTTIVLLLVAGIVCGQTIQSGAYEPGLKLAFDSKTNMLTGYFEDYTGWDESTKAPRFSCVFYLQGRVAGNKFTVVTYYPEIESADTISGQLEIINNDTLSLKLQSEHGGCWNVQHFADEPVSFVLMKKAEWTQLKYVIANKAYFHAEPSEDKRQKAYVVRNDFVCIDRTDGDWSYCTFFGDLITKGWIRTADLNNP